MQTFIYKAKKGPDQVVEGKMIAHNTEDVVNRLSEQGYVATYVKEEVKSRESLRRSWRRSVIGVRLKDRIVFSKQLGIFVKAKVPILKAFMILSQQTSDKCLKRVIDEITDDLKNGESLSIILKNYPEIFSPFYRAMVKTGEESGSLEKSLMHITNYYVREAEFIAKIKSALTYPFLILVVGFFTIIFIFTNVIPKIIPLLINLGVTLPLPTKILIWLSNFLVDNWLLMLLAVVLFTLISKRAMRNKLFTYYLSVLKIKIPILGEMVVKSEFARFARALEICLQSGMPIVKALEVSFPIIREDAIKKSLDNSLKELEAGTPFSSIVKASGSFSPFVYNLIETGEESGNLKESFSLIAESFEADSDRFVKVITTLIEPVMVLVIGAVVALIVSAVLLPIFELNFIQI
ncbi:MAG: type II secretion system F family protein [Candidatus Omnitrophota bacterium]